MNKTFFRVWGTPLLLAVITTFGLLSALLGDGFWHISAWASLAIPLGVISRYALK